SGGVFGCGEFGALDESKIEVVIGDDRGSAVDVADVTANDAGVGCRVKLEAGGDVGRWCDPFDVQGLPRRVVALVLDVGSPGVGSGGDGRLGGLKGGEVPLK